MLNTAENSDVFSKEKKISFKVGFEIRTPKNIRKVMSRIRGVQQSVDEYLTPVLKVKYPKHTWDIA